MLLSELFVNGEFTEDSEEWQKELQRHCEGACSDLDESRELQRRERFAWWVLVNTHGTPMPAREGRGYPKKHHRRLRLDNKTQTLC